MAKSASEEGQRLAALPVVGLDEAAAGFRVFKEFLARFGYLAAMPGAAADAATADVLDEVTSMAIARYQAMHGLDPTGIFDEATRRWPPGLGADFPMCCRLVPRSRRPVPGIGTVSLTRSVRVPVTWGATTSVTLSAVRLRHGPPRSQISFREVGGADSPDIVVAFTPANCGDYNMAGTVLAHADFPPGCGWLGDALPRPVHFDDQENVWCIGAFLGQYDVETVALHEIGHVLGLYHSSIFGAVMFPSAVISPSTNRALHPDDLEGVRALYPLEGPLFAPFRKVPGRRRDLDLLRGRGDPVGVLGWAESDLSTRWVEPGHYRVVAQHSSLVIDVEDISTANGAKLHQWEWWGGDNQKFRLEPVGHGYYRLVLKHSGRSVDVDQISGANGARVIQWDWLAGENHMEGWSGQDRRPTFRKVSRRGGDVGRERCQVPTVVVLGWRQSTPTPRSGWRRLLPDHGRRVRQMPRRGQWINRQRGPCYPVGVLGWRQSTVPTRARQ